MTSPLVAPVVSQAFDLSISGMTCASCVMRVEKALQTNPAIQSATVNLATERAHVVLNPAYSNLDHLDAVSYTHLTLPTIYSV